MTPSLDPDAKWKAGRTHQRLHEILGFVIAVLSIVLLLLGGFMGEIDWTTVSFNVSIVLVALVFPIKEHDKIHRRWGYAYIVFLLLVAAGTWLIGNFVPTIILGFGMVFLLVNEKMGGATSAKETLFWFGVLVVAFLLINYAIPWGQVGGPVGTVGGEIKQNVSVPLVNLGFEFLDLARTCVLEDTEGCINAINAFIDSVVAFLEQILPEPILELLFYMTERGMSYVHNMQCLGQEGGLSGIAFQTDPETTEEAPTQKVADCIQEGPGNSTTEDGGNLAYESVQVSGTSATLTFSNQLDRTQSIGRSAFSVSPGSVGSEGSLSGNQITISLDDMSSVEEGDDVTVTITSTITGQDGGTVSSASCTAPYGGDPAC